MQADVLRGMHAVWQDLLGLAQAPYTEKGFVFVADFMNVTRVLASDASGSGYGFEVFDRNRASQPTGICRRSERFIGSRIRDHIYLKEMYAACEGIKE